jgi:hypothetical protein
MDVVRTDEILPSDQSPVDIADNDIHPWAAIKRFSREHRDRRPLWRRILNPPTGGPTLLICLCGLATIGLIALFCWLNGIG